LEEAQRAFNRMVVIITEAENRRRRDLEDKEVLLKEVHHRVKNNLQLIASIMNMQAREARSSETKRMLANLQRRVRGLAMLHRTLYITPEATEIDARELVQVVIKETASLAREDDVDVTSELASVPLYPDQAVPLSMLVSEAMTNAFKHYGSVEGRQPFVRVILRDVGDSHIELSVSNSLSPQTEAPDTTTLLPIESDGLGRRLMAAFVNQLEGEQWIEEEDGAYTLTVRVPKRTYTPSQSLAAR
ncbi:MAG: sensor histidine kinase, partial [Pseudomonadota bacterium]